MKKLLASVAVLFAAGLSAQSFSVTSHTQGSVANGSTLIFYVAETAALQSDDFDVDNISGANITCKVRRSIQSQASPNDTFYFCTNLQCYAPNTNLSTNVALPSGGQFLLVADFNPEVSGISIVRYSIFNTANPADSVYFFIEYHISPTGVEAHSSVKANIGSPMPNPAAGVFNMNYSLGASYGQGTAKMVIYNMLGEAVKVQTLVEAEGTFRMDVSTLDNGVYFTALEVDGKQLSTKRLVVSH
jgi:hypothetical protein